MSRMFLSCVRGVPVHRFVCVVSMCAAVVAKDELIEIGVDMLAPQAMIRAQRPALQQRDGAVAPGRTTLAAILPTTRGSCR